VTRRNKALTLIFFGITLIGLILLAAGISDLEFNPGEPFSLNEQENQARGETVNNDWMNVLLTVARVFMGLAVILMPFYILYVIFSKQGRLDLIRLLAGLLPMMALLLILSRLPQDAFFNEQLLGENGLNFGDELAGAPLVQFAADPPAWLINLIGILLALFITGLAAIIIINRKRLPVHAHPFERLAQKAEGAIHDLYAGKDLRETIIRCYREMSVVLDQERGIRRNETMTTHEFEELLQGKGLPEGSIHQLTLLFEDVRYGNVQPGEQDETRAIASLNEIVAAMRRKKVRK
jgi:hypothetical protein